MNFKRLGLSLLAAGVVGATACTPATPEGPTVVTAFYALEYATVEVVGEAYTVTNLTTPGVDAHGLELSPSQIASLASADLVVHLSGFQPAVDEAIEVSGATNVLDVADVLDLLEIGGSDHDHGHDEHADDHGHDHDHGDLDPHFWMDPMLLADVADAIAAELGGGDLLRGAEAMRAGMSELDTSFSAALAQCERREFITSHAAFGYLAKAYDLTEIGINGITPNSEASPARIAEVHDLAREHGITTIFFETLTSDAVAKSIAGDLGLVTAVLDPLEGVSDQSPGGDYAAIMEANRDALRTANGCR